MAVRNVPTKPPPAIAEAECPKGYRAKPLLPFQVNLTLKFVVSAAMPLVVTVFAALNPTLRAID
jgi:hypothetical protein